MRMLHYFTGVVLVAVPCLLATAATGLLFDGSQKHLLLGLFASILTVGLHTLLIVFMIVTGRILKAAMQSRPLGSAFLEELNEFFARKKAYPAAIFASTLIVTAAVLGHAQRGFGIPYAVHMSVGLLAVLYNLWAFQTGFRALRENQVLLDRAALELDRIDREVGPPAVTDQSAWTPARKWLLLAVSVWMPYAYWVLVVWKGEASRVPFWPFAAACVVFLAFAWLTRGQEASHEPSLEQSSQSRST